MNFQTFESFQDGASDAGVLFYYAGSFDSETVNVISNKLKEKLQQEPASGPIKRKLFSIFIEMAQNVLHYGRDAAGNTSGEHGKLGAIGMGHEGESYWIACRNLVTTDQIGRITEKLDALRNMSLAEIKTAYREQLANDQHEQSDAVSKGAGLGLLTMARDSTHPIEFSFASQAESAGRYSNFYIKTVI